MDSLQSCGGCAAKMPPFTLRNLLHTLPINQDEKLLVGFSQCDDAAVYYQNPQQAIIHTTDFFPPMINDPYLFGQIAATNALSDVFAMGGCVQTALNLVSFPEGAASEILVEILRGGAEKVQEAGGVLCGGHTIVSPTLTYGLAVTGMVHPDNIWRNHTGQVGDVLILTKPLATALILSAYQDERCTKTMYEAAIESMVTLNRYVAQIGQNYRVHACTDITGFGFLGHLSEMLTDRLGAQIFTENIPFINGAIELALDGFSLESSKRNLPLVEGKMAELPSHLLSLLTCPQTSGGLLLSVHPEDADNLLKDLQKHYPTAFIVGEVSKTGKGKQIQFS